MEIRELYNMTRDLAVRLGAIIARDAEQELDAANIRMFDRILEEAKRLVPNHPILSDLHGLITTDAIEHAEPVRAQQALLQLDVIRNALAANLPPIQIRRTQLPYR